MCILATETNPLDKHTKGSKPCKQLHGSKETFSHPVG